MRALRNLLRYAHPEVTHKIAHLFMKYIPQKHVVERPVIETTLMGVKFDCPVGVGAGIDKDGDLVRTFQATGSGFHVVGSVLLRRNRGNPHPRLYRYPEKLAMINAMGLPSRGVRYVLRNMYREDINIPLIANVAGFTPDEFVRLCEIFDKVDKVKVIELNISCPQYRGVDLHQPELLEALLFKVRNVTSKPLLVKVRPRNIDMRRIVKICETFRNVGITISNSFPVKANFMSSGVGGVSGMPLYKLVRKLIENVRKISDIEVVACGGVFTSRQVIELMRGYDVSLVQVVTAVAYEGPLALVRIIRELWSKYR
ncbi:MAG: hypothetical protein GXO23_06530 [Crenarchaeota archaeon]|nr:hypothetical protein [Thermoproteota archaeon]